MSQLIREMYGDQVFINGYGVLYGVFRRMNPSGYSTPRVRLNTYSSILDLDYLQTASPNKPISFNVAGQTKTITSPLYDNFYLIDNKTENGETVDNINVLCQALGAGMFLLGYLDYTSLDSCGGWKGGRFNFKDKLGWAQRFGVCQVVYKGEQLAQIYALNAKLEQLRQYYESTSESQEIWQREIKETEGTNCKELLDPLKNSPSDRMLKEYMAVAYKGGSYRMSQMGMEHSFFSCRPSDAPYLKQRVFFFLSDFAVIPYCVDALDKSVQEEYECCISSLKEMPLQNPHSDRQIFEDIRNSGFALKPECKNHEHDE